MKRFFYLITALLLVKLGVAQVPNANFETWNPVTTETPAIWSKSGKVSKVAGGQQGSFAVKIESDIVNPVSPVGELYLSGVDGNGVAYSGKMDTLKLWIKYNIANADTATFHVEQVKGFNLVRAGEYYLTAGNSGGNWVEISIPLLPYDTTMTADTMFMDITNTLYSDPQAASYLIIDNMRGYYNGVLQSPLPNFSFETWNTVTTQEIAGWYTTNQLFADNGIDSMNCEQTTDAQSGNYAMRMRNISFFGTYVPGGIVTGNSQEALFAPDQIPTFAAGQRFASLSGWMKYLKKGLDTGEISVYLFSAGMKVGEAHYYQPITKTNYVLIEAKINYIGSFTGVPDSATIFVTSSKDIQNATGASMLWIDNVQLNRYALGVKKNEIAGISVYPNPCKDKLQINCITPNSSAIIRNLEGKELLQTRLDQGSNTIDTRILAAGIYIISINDGEKFFTQKLVKE
jgi:hypothetical protein